MQQVVTNTIRIIGILILGTGLYIGMCIVSTAWKLFDDDSLILSLAERVNKHSGVDTITESLSKLSNFETTVDKKDDSSDEDNKKKYNNSSEKIENITKNINETKKSEFFRPSYFAGWLIGGALLVIIGHIAALTITTGAKLSLYADKSALITRSEIREIIQELTTQSSVYSDHQDK